MARKPRRRRRRQQQYCWRGRNARRRTPSTRSNARRIQQVDFDFPHGALLIMYSDGLATHWSLDDYPGLAGRHPALIAAALYRDHDRGRDDVSVVVMRNTAN